MSTAKISALCLTTVVLLLPGHANAQDNAPADAPPAALDNVNAAIRWRTVNPFRFFVDPADSELHRATFYSLNPDERRQPVLSAERALSARHEEGWAAGIAGRTCWNADKNRFECPDGTPYIHPQSHRIELTLSALPDAARYECTWLTSPRTPNRARGEAVTERCDKAVEFDVPYPDGSGIAVEIAGREMARTTARVTDLLVVGFGDSFGSGEGNPDVPVRFSRERAADYTAPTRAGALAGFPARVGGWRQIGDKAFLDENARWLDQACHRSLYSAQLRAALQLAVEHPHRAVTFAGLACSGAEITTGLFLRYKGNEWVPNPPELSQVSAMAQAQCGRHEAPAMEFPEAYHLNDAIPELKDLLLNKCPADHARKIDLVIISVGGNDIGFARLVANAVFADRTNLRRLGGWFGQVHGDKEARKLMSNLDQRYKSLNRVLRNILHVPWNESDRIILTAYPPLALLEDGKTICPDGTAGMDAAPGLSLSRARAKEGQDAAERLTRVMRTSAREHGWQFAESHRQHYLGRSICAGWMDNALSSVEDLRVPRKIKGEWDPFNPADYRPYASRQRWFRTPNDAFMTGNFHVSASVMQKALQFESLSWFQLLLAATYSGAFHPTAEGHAAIADAIVDRARPVLDKYARRGRTREE